MKTDGDKVPKKNIDEEEEDLGMSGFAAVCGIFYAMSLGSANHDLVDSKTFFTTLLIPIGAMFIWFIVPWFKRHEEIAATLAGFGFLAATYLALKM